MPKNKGKGGKGKRKGKKTKAGDAEAAELRFKEFGEEYAQVRRVLGNCRVECHCFDGKTRLCHVRGKFKKRLWINKDDFVLIGLRDYQDDKGDIVHKYTPDEVRKLTAQGEIPADSVDFIADAMLSSSDDDADSGARSSSSDVETAGEAGDEPGGNGYDRATAGPRSPERRDDQENGEEEVEQGEAMQGGASDDEDGAPTTAGNASEESKAPATAKDRNERGRKQNVDAILAAYRRNNARGKAGGDKRKCGQAETREEENDGALRRGPLVSAGAATAPFAPPARVYNPRAGYSRPVRQQARSFGRKAGIADEEIDRL